MATLRDKFRWFQRHAKEILDLRDKFGPIGFVLGLVDLVTKIPEDFRRTALADSDVDRAGCKRSSLEANPDIAGRNAVLTVTASEGIEPRGGST